MLSPLVIKVTFQPFQTLKQELVHPKNRPREAEERGAWCIASVVVSAHGRTLGRQAGHWIITWQSTDGLSGMGMSASALAEHVFAAGHKGDLSKAMVINTHPHADTHCLLESWHIQHEQAPLNRGKGTLPGLYATSGLTAYYTYLFIIFVCLS